MSRTRKNKLTRNYDIDEETTLSGDKGLLIADEGLDSISITIVASPAYPVGRAVVYLLG